MKKYLLALMMVLPLTAAAQVPATTPTVLSVAELMGNYGLDTAWVNDTAAMVRYLDEQPQNYVELTNLCVTIRTRAQKALASIEHDYQFRDSLIWLDSNTILADYPIYEYRLRNLADMMGRMSIKYSRLEQQRIEAEREAARRRAEEEARRQQEERNRIADDLRGSIGVHDRAIKTACDAVGVTDKNRLKDLKDLYYSYLMVYNKYDLSEGNATDESIARLDQLNSFQNDLLENVLGNNSLPNQIDNFKNVLKVRCEKENGDVYRSYSKVFKHTKVPISFADIKEYEDYIVRLRTIINVQQRYLHTLELRATIAQGTDAITSLYGKKYRDNANAYKEVLKGVNQLPTFTTDAESLLFIRYLEDFIAAQQLYLDFYPVMEDISHRADTILSHKEFSDVVSAYRDAMPSLKPMPGFRDPDGAVVYDNQLAEVTAVQQCYLDVIEFRQAIVVNDDSLLAGKKTDRILTNGYKLLRKQTDLRPSFATVERGRSFIEILRNYIEMQQLGLTTLHKLERINANDRKIKDKDIPYSNIRKAYSRMLKAYQGVDEITNTEDLRRYDRQCDYILEMQEAFIDTQRSSTAADSDSKLKKESNIENIKLVIGL
ncbi:MAG: hypothetical protein IJ524_08480 [Bacteroidales bacterium]|nr:hypothetical protein [Bacteroidales bacterium]